MNKPTTIKRTDKKRLPTYRRLDFPDAEFTLDVFAQFIEGNEVTVDERVAQFLISRGMAVAVTNE